MTTEQRPPEPDVLELVADVVKAWRRQGTRDEGGLAAALNALERVWPR